MLVEIDTKVQVLRRKCTLDSCYYLILTSSQILTIWVESTTSLKGVTCQAAKRRTLAIWALKLCDTYSISVCLQHTVLLISLHLWRYSIKIQAKAQTVSRLKASKSWSPRFCFTRALTDDYDTQICQNYFHQELDKKALGTEEQLQKRKVEPHDRSYRHKRAPSAHLFTAISSLFSFIVTILSFFSSYLRRNWDTNLRLI